jgi:hypothetical protein
MICFSEVNFIEEAEIGLDEKTMDILCDRALSSLQVLHGNPGVWDIFITKHVQVSYVHNIYTHFGRKQIQY